MLLFLTVRLRNNLSIINLMNLEKMFVLVYVNILVQFERAIYPKKITRAKHVVTG